jgi:hypothetical protein
LGEHLRPTAAQRSAVRRSTLGRAFGKCYHFFRRQRVRRVVGQAPRRDDAAERFSFDRDIEVARAQPADVGHQPALRAGHLLGGADLRGGAQQSVELRDRVAGNLVVQTLGCLRREDEPETVLACLRRQRQRAACAGRESDGANVWASSITNSPRSGRSSAGLRLIQANSAICNWLTKLCRCSSEDSPIMLITDTRARRPDDGVSSTPGSSAVPAPPNILSLTIAARRFSAKLAAILRAPARSLASSGRSLSMSTNPLSVGSGFRPYNSNAFRSTARSRFAFCV